MNQPQTTALLLLDLQNEMVDPKGKVGAGGLAKVVAERQVIEHSAHALAGARSAGMKVVHVRLGFRADYLDALSLAPRVKKMKEGGVAVAGTWATEFPAALAPRDNELVVTKQCVNPFFNTGLMNWLHSQGIKNLVFGGVATNLVVEMTARAADDAGFGLTVLEDCCAAPNPAWHAFSVENMLPLFASVSSARAVFG